MAKSLEKLKLRYGRATEIRESWHGELEGDLFLHMCGRKFSETWVPVPSIT